MKTPSQLCPRVRVTADRNVFLVQSGTNPKRWWRVDGEARSGLMFCECPGFRNRKICPHLPLAKEFVACVAMQGAIQ